MKNNKLEDKITILIVCIGFFIITPYLIKCIFQNPETRNTLINYVGAIYSGLMTIIGVGATIIYEKNERNKDIELQYRPLIKIDEREAQGLPTNGEIDISTDFEKYEMIDKSLSKNLIIKNIGRGEMLDINLYDIKVRDILASPNSEQKYDVFFCFGDKYDELGINDQLSFFIMLPTRKEKIGNYSELFEISFKISFYGCLHKTKYEYLISFCIDSKNIYQNDKSYEDKLYNYKVTKLK